MSDDSTQPTFVVLVNGSPVELQVAPDTPLLWALRDHLGLTGTKFGCGIGACGACTVHLNGVPMRSCILPVAGAIGQQVTTIEGLKHAVQQAWIDEQVPQCGYCQSGQLMAAAALLDRNASPTDDEISAAMTNLCRCGTYERIRKGIHRAAAVMGEEAAEAQQESMGDESEDAEELEGTPHE